MPCLIQTDPPQDKNTASHAPLPKDFTTIIRPASRARSASASKDSSQRRRTAQTAQTIKIPIFRIFQFEQTIDQLYLRLSNPPLLCDNASFATGGLFNAIALKMGL
jgi:hypothetical protein